jgi:hypothetical protein
VSATGKAGNVSPSSPAHEGEQTASLLEPQAQLVLGLLAGAALPSCFVELYDWLVTAQTSLARFLIQYLNSGLSPQKEGASTSDVFPCACPFAYLVGTRSAPRSPRRRKRWTMQRWAAWLCGLQSGVLSFVALQGESGYSTFDWKRRPLALAQKRSAHFLFTQTLAMCRVKGSPLVGGRLELSAVLKELRPTGECSNIHTTTDLRVFDKSDTYNDTPHYNTTPALVPTAPRHHTIACRTGLSSTFCDACNYSNNKPNPLRDKRSTYCNLKQPHTHTHHYPPHLPIWKEKFCGVFCYHRGSLWTSNACASESSRRCVEK